MLEVRIIAVCDICGAVGFTKFNASEGMDMGRAAYPDGFYRLQSEHDVCSTHTVEQEYRIDGMDRKDIHEKLYGCRP